MRRESRWRSRGWWGWGGGDGPASCSQLEAGHPSNFSKHQYFCWSPPLASSLLMILLVLCSHLVALPIDRVKLALEKKELEASGKKPSKAPAPASAAAPAAAAAGGAASTAAP